MRLAPPADEALRSDPLPEALSEARGQPAWSALSEHCVNSPRREAALRALARQLLVE
jgi:hypothetical protein